MARFSSVFAATIRSRLVWRVSTIAAVVLATGCILVGCSLLTRASPSISEPHTIAVHVVDAVNQSPIANAVVSTGTYNTLSDAIIGKTDSSGDLQGNIPFLVYKIPECTFDVSTSPERVWIVADGYVPQSLCVSQIRHDSEHNQSDPITVQLATARPIRGRIVQTSGDPVSNEAMLLVGLGDSWPVQWQTVTDENGCFEWKDAPQGDIYVALGLGDSNSTPEFQQVDVADGEAVVHVGSTWHGVGAEPERKLFYIVFQKGQPVFPPSSSPLHCTRFDFDMESILYEKNQAVQHFVVSMSSDWCLARFLCLGGTNGHSRAVGEMSLESPDAEKK